MATSEDQTKAPPAEETSKAENAVAAQVEGVEGDEPAVDESLVNFTIVLPNSSETLAVTIPSHEQFSEVRQIINEAPAAQEYSCFHIEYNGKRINEFGLVSEIPDLAPEAEIRVVLDPYTEKEARLHLIRIRDLIGAAAPRPDAVQGVLPGLSIFDSVSADATAAAEAAPVEYDFDSKIDPSIILPRLTADEVNAPKTVKAIQISPWNPPPVHLRHQGHLLYLIITTNEGEQVQVTAHVGGFYVNKSSNAKFDPQPRPAPKNQSAHSLLSLIRQLSPSFDESFAKLQEFNSKRDPLSTYQISNALPAAPWLVPALSSPSVAHSADITRTQEAYLISGTDSVDNLRDWNEELQSARELPRETVQDRIFRERLVAKVFADYIDAATHGALLVAAGEINPLNPTEGRDAQIFVYNNIFFSYGADGVGTFTSEGGDEAARVATGKDVAGVRRVNQLDIDGLYSPGTVVVDYLGKRIVGQSLVPGIFKQREPGENQIDYGAVDGKDVVAADERFAEPFAKLSQSLNVKPHTVWDGEGKAVKLEASVETKGLMGTDGRKYVLDLYRITPLDFMWQEEGEEAEKAGESAYPHRMTVLRPELIEAYSRFKLREWLDGELAKRTKAKAEAEAAKAAKAAKKAAKAAKAAKKESSDSEDSSDSEEDSSSSDESSDEDSDEEADDKKKDEKPEAEERIDVSNFKFSLNPDVFSGQVPQTDEEKEQMTADEKDVRAVGDHLRAIVIPGLIRELSESDISFPMDGRSLTQLLHKVGINMRYLGRIAKATEGENRLVCLHTIAIREMISRAFKHVSSKYLRYLPLPLTSACIAHLLNCLLGAAVNASPVAEVDSALRALYSDADLAFEKVTPESLRKDIEAETARRFRFTLPADWYSGMTGHLQLLREVSLKLGVQILGKKFAFSADEAAAIAAAAAEAGQNGKANGATNGASHSEGGKKKKNKKAARDASPSVNAEQAAPRAFHTFSAEDVVNVVPIVKNAAPRSTLSEEAMEAGRISLSQNQVKVGQELFLESLSLHEQIYGILHPEVARAYSTLATIYYQLDEKEAAVELSRKAVIVSERVVGVDSSETIQSYLNLGLFVHSQGDSALALGYLKHAYKLWQIVYGPDHPDSITTINNAAVMLQNVKAFHESRRWFEESLRLSNKVFGESSLNSATLLFQLAQSLALDNDSKGSVVRMRECYNIFLSEMGAEDKNTKEAEHWLNQLTSNAVNIAKHTKDAEARRIRAGINFPTRGPAGSAAAGSASKGGVTAAVSSKAAGAAPAIVGGKDGVDSRSIDELMRYIEGSEGKKKSSANKKRGIPKQRGGKA